MVNLNGDAVYLIPKSKYLGQFYVANVSTFFHGSVTCGKLTSGNAPIREVPIVTLDGEYIRSSAKVEWGRKRTLLPCTVCKPLEDQLGVEPIDFPDAVCRGRDDEWVRDFRSKAGAVLQPQRECMKCPHLEECYALFEKERPPLGVMGGCTDQQYREYGHACLSVMKAKVRDEDRATT